MTEKTVAELVKEQREAIPVTTPKKEGGGEGEGDTKTETETETETEEELVSTEENSDNKENDEGEGEGEQLTAKDIEKLKKTITRLQRRVDKTTAEKAATAKELAEAKTALAAKPDDEKVLTEADVETRAERIATQKQLERDFVNSCNKLAKDAKKIDKDFDAKVKMMAEDAGEIPASMIGILDELDNGGEVLNHLANNVDDYEEIRELSPARMSIRLAKLSDKLETDKKPKPQQISNAPKPMAGVGGKSNGATTVITGKEDMNEFVRKRAAQLEERRKAKAAGYR